MKNSRRDFLGLSTIGLVSTLPAYDLFQNEQTGSVVHSEYPSTLYSDISAVVGASHANFDKVKELVDKRPELAKATWDWGFGDVESALGAASHMGRKDIAEYLIKMGARPDIFTFAMLGKVDAVRGMIQAIPGIATILGPHGFTLMHHAEIRLRRKNVEGSEKDAQEAMVEYLQSVAGTDTRSKSLEISDEEKNRYVGRYTFGPADNEYFEVALNSRKLLSIGRGSFFGRSLNKLDEHVFAPSGGPSVRIVFTVENGSATDVSIYDPKLIVTATRV